MLRGRRDAHMGPGVAGVGAMIAGMYVVTLEAGPGPLVAGSEVVFFATVQTRSAHIPALKSPSSGVKLTLLDPAGVVIVNAHAMSVVSTGFYTDKYQTTGASTLGNWTAYVKIDDATDGVAYSRTQEVFTLVVS